MSLKRKFQTHMTLLLILQSNEGRNNNRSIETILGTIEERNSS